jgi:hypothetical protein
MSRETEEEIRLELYRALIAAVDHLEGEVRLIALALNVRFCPDSDHRADVAGGPKGARSGHSGYPVFGSVPGFIRVTPLSGGPQPTASRLIARLGRSTRKL